jgi:3-hydroxyacyl-[acyl-carrier-protein] dehydratase
LFHERATVLDEFFGMRLTLIDRIIELTPGSSIKALKCLTLNENYLADHFPQFPVMPGVLMLEAMYQTAAWLVRATDDFRYSMVVMAEVRNVKYSDFVLPGQTLLLAAELISHEVPFSTLKCQGEVDGNVAVRGKLVLRRYNLAEISAHDSVIDAHAINRLREKLEILYAVGNSKSIN